MLLRLKFAVGSHYKKIKMYKQLTAYKKAFELAMKIFEITKSFPKEERYSLTDQIRRSSRSVCANFAEGYRKRLYPKHFISKLSDADMENSELSQSTCLNYSVNEIGVFYLTPKNIKETGKTQVWLDFTLACEYITKEIKEELHNKSEEVGKHLGYMIQNSEKFKK